MTTKAEDPQDRLAELEHKIETLSGKIEDYSRELQAQRDRQEDEPVAKLAPEAASGVPLPWWWNEDYPAHPDFEARQRAKVEAAQARAKEPIIVDTSGAVPKPAGWDDPTPGNPYNPAVIAQRQADHEREVAENRERDREVVRRLNGADERGISGV